MKNSAKRNPTPNCTTKEPAMKMAVWAITPGNAGFVTATR